MLHILVLSTKMALAVLKDVLKDIKLKDEERRQTVRVIEQVKAGIEVR